MKRFEEVGPEDKTQAIDLDPEQEIRSRRRFCKKIYQFVIPNPPAVPEGVKNLGFCTLCGLQCIVLGAYGGDMP